MSEARARIDDWVAAGLCLQRGASIDAAVLTMVLPWLDATLEILALLPPLGVIADIGRLLTRAPFDIARSTPVADPALREAVDAYEEHVLGRLAADYRLELARDALLRLDESLRPAAVAVFAEQVLARLRCADNFDSPGPAAIRRVLHRHGSELLELAGEVLAVSEDDPMREELQARYIELARGARQCGALIGDVELFTLENHEALRNPSQRLAMAQIAEAAQAVERGLPVRVRRSEASRGRTPTRVEDESAYPIGGYSSISTIGGIESLVSSELIYMNPPHERAAGIVDLFDVRWAAGELLKYTRDESVHTRERRTITVVLCPELEQARIKDAEVPWQRLVIALGGLVAGVRKLGAWLDEAELHLHFVLVAAPPLPGRARSQPLAPEAALLRLLLREYMELGVVEFFDLDTRAHARAHALEAAGRGGSDLVWILGEDEFESPPPREDAHSKGPVVLEHGLSVARAQPRAWIGASAMSPRAGSGESRAQRSASSAPRGSGWEAWTRTFADLFQALV